MAMDKELSLIYDFKNAPAELKKAADVHLANSKALSKKVAQRDALNEEISAMQGEYEAAAKAFRLALKAWEPDAEGAK